MPKTFVASLAVFTLIPTLAAAQSASPDQTQLCNLVNQTRAMFADFNNRLAAESNPLNKADLQTQFKNAGSTATNNLIAFKRSHNPIQSLTGTVTYLGPNTNGGSGASLLVVLDCPSHPTNVVVDFNLRFDTIPDPANWATIGPFMSVLRTLHQGDKINFSGTWGNYSPVSFGDQNNPTGYILITTALNKL